jgi:hypothetical protein
MSGHIGLGRRSGRAGHKHGRGSGPAGRRRGRGSGPAGRERGRGSGHAGRKFSSGPCDVLSAGYVILEHTEQFIKRRL